MTRIAQSIFVVRVVLVVFLEGKALEPLLVVDLRLQHVAGVVVKGAAL